ncbi:ABC transporter ATP-binding protein [Arthrobacter livingstonensis]|uniref:ABC transporter ATP-binding protein n=1 Tax=Arthrobacter livingstonensis TaxID=670078 RepID=A0A2V5LHD7_9MICC|nr:ABC transporter ATP-binding protein [Arthrobacter livingstonensis]PYI66010.1 ABC transporter ATP-binding protein [Arthrobacter livingstonensis]
MNNSTTSPELAPHPQISPTAPPPAALLAVDATGLHKSFGTAGRKVHAVNGVDLQIRPGEVVAFLGPNGAGKTTTIDMLLGLSKPDGGSITIFGLSPRAAIAQGLVSAVMQSGGLLKDLTVRETVSLTGSLFSQTQPVDEVLERAGILDIAGRRVEKCSGGQQQRLRFAMALLSDPGLLILDEPTTGMDVEGRRDFWSAIRADTARGRTVIFATHYLEEADAYADRIVLVRRGEIVADGTAAEIKNLASGRTVNASVHNADAAALAAIPGVDSVESRGGRLSIRTKDSDAVARYLLTATDAVDLEITSHNLEDAFVALTGDRDGSDGSDGPDGSDGSDGPDGPDGSDGPNDNTGK